MKIILAVCALSISGNATASAIFSMEGGNVFGADRAAYAAAAIRLAPPKGTAVEYQNLRYELRPFWIDKTDHSPSNYGIEALGTGALGRFDIGLGFMYLDHSDEFNGSRLNFSLLARLRVTDHWLVSMRHFSNAGATKPNIGRNIISVGYSF